MILIKLNNEIIMSRKFFYTYIFANINYICNEKMKIDGKQY